MMGREHEKQAVDDLLATARSGRAGALLLVGLPGIGKTTLLDHGEATARAAGMTTFRITAVESESGISGSGLSLLRPLLGEGNLADPWTLLSSVSEAAALQPLALVVDDVQWLDEASLAALRFAARRLLDDAVALLLAARPEIDDPPRLPEIEHLAVEALPRAEAAALLLTVSPSTPPEVAYELAASLGDVPLALVEAPALLAPEVMSGAAPLPPTLPVGRSVSAHYARGVDALPAPARRALVIASSEDSGDTTVLARALLRAELSPRDLEPAVDAGLLLPGAELRFRHPLVRAAVHWSATEAERRAAHRLLAEVHRELDDAELMLRHSALAAVGPDEDLAAGLEAMVPDVAARRGTAAAGALAAQAAALSPLPDARWRRLVLSLELDRFRASSARAAREVVERCSDPELRARAAIVLGEEHLTGQEQTGLFRESLTWISNGPAGRELVEVYGDILMQRLDYDGVQRAAEMLESWGPEGSLGLDSLMPGGMWQFLGQNERALPLLRQGLVASEQVDPEQLPLPYLSLWLMAPAWLDEASWDGETLASRKRTACSLFRRSREPRWAALADRFDAEEALDRAQHAKAAGILRNLLSLAPSLGWLVTDVYELLAIVESRRGDDIEAEIAIEALAAACDIDDFRYTARQARYCRALLHLRSGRNAEALAELADVEALQSTRPRGVAFASLALKVEVLSGLGRTGEAQRIAVELEHRSRGLGSRRAAALVELGHALAQTDDTERRFDEAVRLGRLGTNAWELARILLLQGEWLRRSRRPADARAPLTEATQLFRRSDAAPWAERAERELAAAGGSLSSPARIATVGLTPQELRIALAVAEGLSNNEIASTVFLSVKTVETHLTRIYRKLGVRSRGGVAKALADAGVAT
ncbi:LuxR C-terminal-related transcriptional regulator [Longivirga aurantiaca]|uniref:LuxR C-terminal-related transcriptional regulator n=1 Tax=Longivirga aurantiaca TaxID=1837743 RepID=A0ABW1SYM9_9ACTN